MRLKRKRQWGCRGGRKGAMVTKQESVEGLCRVETEQQDWGLLCTVSHPGVWDLSKFLRLTGPPQGSLMTSRLCRSASWLRKCYHTHTWSLDFQEVILPMVGTVLLCLPFLSPYLLSPRLPSNLR